MVEKKIWYKIDLSCFENHTTRKNSYVVKITKHNYHKWFREFDSLIWTFDDEIGWNGWWGKKTATKRFREGQVMYLFLEGTTPMGCVWFKDNYLHNLFVSKKRKDGDSVDFLREVLYNRREVFDSIYLYADEWNIKAHKLFQKLGFVEYENEE